MRHGSAKQFQLGQANLLPVFHYSDDDRKPIRVDGKTWLKPPEEFVFGYWTLAVFVHPANPIAAVTREQLGRALTKPGATWKDLGQASDSPIKVYGVDNFYVAARAIDAPYEAIIPRLVQRKPGSRSRDELEDAAADPAAVGIWYYSQINVGKGFKVVPILDEGGQARWPSDAAAVCSGRYPLRVTAQYLVHPEANQATKEFTRWLLTPEAGKAIAEARGRMPAGRIRPCPHFSTLRNRSLPTKLLGKLRRLLS